MSFVFFVAIQAMPKGPLDGWSHKERKDRRGLPWQTRPRPRFRRSRSAHSGAYTWSGNRGFMRFTNELFPGIMALVSRP